MISVRLVRVRLSLDKAQQRRPVVGHRAVAEARVRDEQAVVQLRARMVLVDVHLHVEAERARRVARQAGHEAELEEEEARPVPVGALEELLLVRVPDDARDAADLVLHLFREALLRDERVRRRHQQVTLRLAHALVAAAQHFDVFFCQTSSDLSYLQNNIKMYNRMLTNTKPSKV